jgi:hypothetical protein
MKAVSDYYSKYLPTVLGKTRSSNEQLASQLADAGAGAGAGDGAGAGAGAGGGDVPDGRPATQAEQQAHHDAVEQSMGPIEGSHAEAAEAIDLAALDYTDVEQSDLVVMGRAFNDAQEYFNRLPGSAEGVVRDAVWGLSKMSTGMFVPFVTNSR